MMQELLWLLLPIAALSGWMAAKRAARRANSGSEKAISPEYYKGLNFLLNEQPDKAIEVFIRLVEVDSETVETHLALGGLFRRRGEVERAIRIHQNLIARPSLSQRQRALALLELGKDYMRAGLLDRAEGLFNEVLKHGNETTEAYKNLVDIYQQENEWDKAIQTAKKYETISGNIMNGVIAHFYCELAEEEKRARNKHKVSHALKKALDSDPNCVRASILLGDIAYDERDYKNALKYYLKIFDQDESFVPEVIGKILACIRKGASLNGFRTKLLQLRDDKELHPYLPGLSRFLLELEGEEQAISYVNQYLQNKPSLHVLKEWLELGVRIKDTEEYVKLESIKAVTDRLLKEETTHQCKRCGFSSKLLYWQCPGCRMWGSVKPVNGVMPN